MAIEADELDAVDADDAGGATDGRVLRGRRNREAIVEAMVSMYRDGNLRPTASQVAEAAGLSTRSVYHHFDDMKSLVIEVSSRAESDVDRPDFDEMSRLSLDLRISTFATHRFDRWFHTSAVVRAGLLAEYDSTIVASLMSLGREHRLEEAETVFADRLATSKDPESTAAGLDVVFGYDMWHRLTDIRGLDDERARRIVTRLATALLSDAAAD